MSLSRHAQVAAALTAYVAGWGSLLTGVTVSRVGSVTQYLSGLPDDQVGTIALIAANVTDERGARGTDLDQITVGVCVIGHVPKNELDALDAWDLFSEALRDYLRRARQIALDDGTAAMRVSTGLPTPWDADLLHRKELFFSVIECVYQVEHSIATALPPEGL